MLTNRSKEKELLDLGSEYYHPDEYAKCLRKLFRINQLMGCFRNTRRILKKFPDTSSVLDVGCGDGLFILHLNKIFPNMQFHGIDTSGYAIQIAQQELKNWQEKHLAKNVTFARQTAEQLNLMENTADIVLTTLVCHHLSDEELVIFLCDALTTARKAVIINDLHRHIIPHVFFRIVSPLFRNRLISNDGLISIRRSFKYKEWRNLLEAAHIEHFQIRWRFPFYWQIILWKN